MGEIRGAQFRNLSQSELVKLGAGKIYGVIVNSNTSGTMKVLDGIDDTAGAKATATLTVSGSLTPAKFAKSILTSDTTEVADGEVVVVGAITYRFKDTLAQAYDVKIGASVTITLANLRKAINGTGTPGTEYFAGTVAHPLVIASASDATTVTCYSRTYGTANNTLATTTTATHLSWSAATLGAGTSTSIAGVATAGATFTIGSQTYYFTTLLSETLLGASAAVANEILWVTNDATALDNMKLAINGSGVEGTDYSTGTSAHADVIATTNGNTTQVIESRFYGTIGNGVTTVSEGMTGVAWSGESLTGGTAGARQILNTFTFVTATSQVVTFPEPINFVQGLFLVLGGTADVTVLYD